jgi:hypothetical protein
MENLWRNDETMEKPVGNPMEDVDSDGYSENCMEKLKRVMEKYSKLKILDRYFNQRYLS